MTAETLTTAPAIGSPPDRFTTVPEMAPQSG